VKPTKVFLPEEVPLPAQCATNVLHRAISVAEGAFAPGHLGELTQYLPFELVDDILVQTHTVQRRLRVLPSRVGVYFVVALALFPRLGYARVWDKLVAGLRGLPLPAPSEKALRDLRRRLGAAPFKMLFETIAGPLAQPATPGVRYRRWRTVAFDGCASLQAPDQPRNRAWLSKVLRVTGMEAFPHLRLMALCETGTRGLIGAVFGPLGTGELRYARLLLPLLTDRMLVLADRGFASDDFLSAVAATGSQLLIRAQGHRRPVVLAKLPDGSVLTRIQGRTFRVIDAHVQATCSDGRRIGDRYLLITTLLDHRTDSATALIRLYHERWEVESMYLSLRHTLLTGRVLRSCDQFGLEQELWALLCAYQSLRRAIVDAVETVPGLDPDRAGFTVALQTAADQLVAAAGVLDTHANPLVGAIGEAVLSNLLPPRRLRLSIRRVKRPVSRFCTQTGDQRPIKSQRIARIDIAITDAQSTSAPPRQTGHDSARPTSRRDRTLQLLRNDPDRSWTPQEIAAALGVDHLQSLGAQLSAWIREGYLEKPSRGHYRLHPTWITNSEP
jgi:hypothetical protein